jgi:MFS transporter, NNP family, nitrate/nitrite transporter
MNAKTWAGRRGSARRSQLGSAADLGSIGAPMDAARSAFPNSRADALILLWEGLDEMPWKAREASSKILCVSTLAFAVCFAVWTIFSIVGIGIKGELGLNETEFGLLVATPILTGSLARVPLGIWSDRYGGRLVFVTVMFASAIATFTLPLAHTYKTMLLAALGLGVAGGSFAVGVSYVSRWYPKAKQGTALGIFGVGNVGAAVTTFVAPFVMVAYGWPMVAEVWAAALAVMAAIFWSTTADDPVQRTRRAGGLPAVTLRQQLAPLANLQVWRFSLYYFFVFGGFVALALWLPHFYIGAYHLDVKTAGILGAVFLIAASLMRAFGGALSDRIGARRVMYWCFGASVLVTFVLACSATDFLKDGVHGDLRFGFGLGVVPFVTLTFILGIFMPLGSAAVFRHVAVYYPYHVGPVGGVVGMIGGLGGFVLPIAFGALYDLTGLWTSCFMLLFLIVTLNLIWMHAAIHRMARATLAATDRSLKQGFGGRATT